MSFPLECAFNLWRSRNIVLEMVQYRGYTTTEKVISWEDWKERFGEYEPLDIMDLKDYSRIRLEMCFEASSESGKIAVRWHPGDKFGIKHASEFEREIRDYVVVIFIHNSKISSQGRAHLRILEEIGEIYLDIFNDEETFKNITKNPLVPRQTICSKNIRSVLFKTYTIRQEPGEIPGMPLILTTDPVAKFIGARHGDVVRSERPVRSIKFENIEYKPCTIFYRYVVKV